MVSVVVICYNAQNYIEECLKSVFNQSYTNLELILSDDCSSDNTCRIAESICEKQNRAFIINRNTRNVGSYKNMLKAISLCQGEFIAYLEGDDYWIDNDKIVNQVDFLLNNPNYNSIVTNCLRKELDGDYKDYRPINKNEYSTRDLFGYTQFHSSTLLYRSGVLNNYPINFSKVVSNDKTLFVLLSLTSPIYFLNKRTSVYRIHAKSITKSRSFFSLQWKQSKWLWKVNLVTNFKYFRTIATTYLRIVLMPSLKRVLRICLSH